MAVYYSIRCPNCNNVVASGKNRTKQYGSPFRKCRYCGSYYIDRDYTEAGLLDPGVLNSPELNWQSVVLVLVCIPFLYVFIVESIFVGLIIPGILMILGIASIISSLRHRPIEDPSVQRELLESKKRLSDPHYVLALWDAKIKVPPTLLKWAQTAIAEKSDAVESRANSQPTQHQGKPLEEHQPTAAPTIRLCHNCSAKLLEDSKFCARCGTAIETAERTSQTKTSPATKPVQSSATTKHTKTSTSAKPTTTNVAQKYCSRCGKAINPQTKKCTGCGKQYFKGIPWKTIGWVIVGLLGTASFALNVYFITKLLLNN